MIGKIQTKGYSLVPISLYFKGSLVKLELGIGKGKKLYDKRADIAKKDAERRIQIALKGNYYCSSPSYPAFSLLCTSIFLFLLSLNPFVASSISSSSNCIYVISCSENI